MPRIKEYERIYMSDLKHWSDERLKEEYVRRRSVADSRVISLAKHGYKPSIIGEYMNDRILDVRTAAPEMIKMSLITTTKFLRARESTVTGMQAIQHETVEKLKKWGIDIDVTQLGEFNKWMSLWKAMGLDRVLPSKDWASSFNSVNQDDEETERPSDNVELRRQADKTAQELISKTWKRGRQIQKALKKMNNQGSLPQPRIKGQKRRKRR